MSRLASGHCAVRAVLVLLVLVLVAVPPAVAQEIPGVGGGAEQPAAAAVAEPTSPEAIAARRRAVAQELTAASASLEAAGDDANRAHVEAVREQLRAIDSLLRKQADLAAAPAAAAPAPADLAPEAEASLFALNELYEAQAEAERRQELLDEVVSASRAALASTKEKFEEAERRRREARRQFEEEEAPRAKTRAERALALRQLASRAAEERVHLRTLESRAATRERAALGEAERLDERIAAMRRAIGGESGQPNAALAALAEQAGALRRERQTAERSLSTLELRLEALQQRFSSQADAAETLLPEVDALIASRDALRQKISMLDAALERLDAQHTLWRRWQAALRGEGTRDEWRAWSEEASERVDALEQTELQHLGQRLDLERRLENVDERLAQLPPNAPPRSLLEEQRAALADVLEVAKADAAALAADRRLSERVLGELRDQTGQIDPLEYLAQGVQSVRDVWAYEITTVDDSPITVGSLVLALLFAGIGLWASRHGSALVGRMAAERFRLDSGAAHALQTLSFYFLLVGFTLLALRAVHFPLTAFTVLGGALAIGIGFGSQNVMNNFISGLILMLERPIRAGDVVEVDSSHGTIERIGARSTQIRATDGRHIVVPNSFFLENNVVNWTLSDDLVRTKVLVGVIYGSPTRLVEELIRRVVDEDEQVLQQPAPILLFDEFGDNSLNFEVHFWVNARSPMAMREVQSRLRFRIDDLFREHDLVIAFPQRDVHLDSVSPIEVRVLKENASVSNPPTA